MVLPHAHVTPDDALGCLRFSRESVKCQQAAGHTPSITVVQLPCCGYIWHDLCCGVPPNADALDVRICATARAVRVWHDVSSHFDFTASEFGRGVPRGCARQQQTEGSTVRKREERRSIQRERQARRAEAGEARLAQRRLMGQPPPSADVSAASSPWGTWMALCSVASTVRGALPLVR